MKLVKRGSNLLRQGHRRRPASPQFEWWGAYPRGVLLFVGGDELADRLEVDIRDDAGERLDAERGAIVGMPGGHLLAYSVPDGFRQNQTYSIRASAGRDVLRRTIQFGVGTMFGHIEGIADYCVRGWVCSWDTTERHQVELIIDGRKVAEQYADRARPEFVPIDRGMSWSGFEIPIPRPYLGGTEHRIEIKCRDARFELDQWRPAPLFHIDSVAPLSGWFLDRNSIDAPTTLSLMLDDYRVASVRTTLREDVRDKFGFSLTGFSFPGVGITAGSTLVAGDWTGGLELGEIEQELLGSVTAVRREARTLLIEQGVDTSLAKRTKLAGIVVDHRKRLGPGLVMRRREDAERRSPDLPHRSWNRSSGGHRCCVIVPVYKGLDDLKACIDSIVPQLGDGRRAIVINDKSPEQAVVRYLDQIEGKHHGLQILHNAENIGFVGSVNRGFGLLERGEDAVIVNSDAILSSNALTKLARTCHDDPGIASVTGMSNNATILSFPDSPAPNRPLFGLSATEIDRLFERAVDRREGRKSEIPTGVGYCMYMNRRAIDEIGLFDPEWRKGYCEEVDWCLKARDLGWIHLVAEDTFVIHEGSVSFGVAEREAILLTNHARLEAKYPEYLAEIASYVRADKLAALRLAAFSEALATRTSKVIVCLAHNLGGGTAKFIADLGSLPRDADHDYVIIEPSGRGDGRVRLKSSLSDAHFTVDGRAVEAFLSVLGSANVAVNVIVNSRIGFDSRFLSMIFSGEWPTAVMFHDFQWYCPRVNLTDGNRFYCGEPSIDVCRICVLPGVPYDFADHNRLVRDDIGRLVAFNRDTLRRASILAAPSSDTASRYAERLGLSNVRAVPHPREVRSTSARAYGPSNAHAGLRLATVGTLAVHKGYEIIEGLAEHAYRTKQPVLIDVIGHTDDDQRLTRFGNVRVAGRYASGEVETRLAECDPDFVLFASVWPETYSYVLSEVWAAGYPVVAFDFGAVAERIKREGGGVVIPASRDAGEIWKALSQIRFGRATEIPKDTDQNRYGDLDAYLERLFG